jgi:hypothetical protein
MTAHKKPGRPRKSNLPDGYTIAQSTTGKWVVYLHGSVRYAADTENDAIAYVERMSMV